MEQHPRLVSVNARFTVEELGLNVDVRLRDLDGRWIAVANFGDEPEVGIGATPPQGWTVKSVVRPLKRTSLAFAKL